MKSWNLSTPHVILLGWVINRLREMLNIASQKTVVKHWNFPSVEKTGRDFVLDTATVPSGNCK